MEVVARVAIVQVTVPPTLPVVVGSVLLGIMDVEVVVLVPANPEPRSLQEAREVTEVVLDDERATLTPTEQAILEERMADLDDEEKILTVEELRARFRS
jgi:hypothetical protein